LQFKPNIKTEQSGTKPLGIYMQLIRWYHVCVCWRRRWRKVVLACVAAKCVHIHLFVITLFMDKNLSRNSHESPVCKMINAPIGWILSSAQNEQSCRACDLPVHSMKFGRTVDGRTEAQNKNDRPTADRDAKYFMILPSSHCLSFVVCVCG
jgi:hypothetical protein